VDFSFQYKRDSPARLRLPHAGDFNVEIPVEHPALRPGANRLALRVRAADGRVAERAVEVLWDPAPRPARLELSDLSAVASPQEIGQVVDGRWDVDPILGVIRARAPAAPDSLLLLGSPQGSQEAEYAFRYFDGSRSKYVGLSDFFVGHEVERPDVPIKPGWSTAGLATSRPRGEGAWEARLWIARGDRPGWRPSGALDDGHRREFHVVRTEPAVFYELAPRRWYRVRHQVRFGPDGITARVRLWPEGEPEPDAWLCEERDEAPDAPRRASFGLFQHSGLPSEWRDVRLRPLRDHDAGPAGE
jgi:hypothetical protein